MVASDITLYAKWDKLLTGTLTVDGYYTDSMRNALYFSGSNETKLNFKFTIAPAPTTLTVEFGEEIHLTESKIDRKEYSDYLAKTLEVIPIYAILLISSFRAL